MPELLGIKAVIVDATGLSKDALHVYTALLLHFGSALLFGWRLRSWKPWLVVLGVTVAGEVWDYFDILREDDPVSWSNHGKDLWNTMLAPTAIVLLAQYTPLFARETEASDEPPEPEE